MRKNSSHSIYHSLFSSSTEVVPVVVSKVVLVVHADLVMSYSTQSIIIFFNNDTDD